MHTIVLLAARKVQADRDTSGALYCSLVLDFLPYPFYMCNKIVCTILFSRYY
jgi:hypothetical protein